MFPLSVYSVEALYYNPTIVEAVATRQCVVLGGNSAAMISQAWTDMLTAIASEIDRLAARLTEQTAKDQASLGMFDWKKIQSGQNISIAVDAQALYSTEKTRLQTWITAKDVGRIIARYPIRETAALGAIASALQFKNKHLYESAVRKVVTDDYYRLFWRPSSCYYLTGMRNFFN